MNEKLQAEVAAIARDETLRELVREHLPSSRKPKSRLWSLLNSAFVLWVLSSVMLASLSWLYAHWSARRAEEAARLQRVQQLDIEIAYRLSVGNVSLGEFRQALCLPPSSLITARNTRERYIFPEFSNRSAVSLMWELENLVPREQREEIRQVRTHMSNLAEQQESATSPAENIVDLKEFILPRWLECGLLPSDDIEDGKGPLAT